MSDDIITPKKVLLGQARALGLKVDGRWSVDTLAEKVLEAQEAASEAKTQAIRDASDTWVFMIRDGWAVEDERLKAGGTFKVPVKTAEIWYEAGVARPPTGEAARAIAEQEALKAAAVSAADRDIEKLDKEMLQADARKARLAQVRV